MAKGALSSFLSLKARMERKGGKKSRGKKGGGKGGPQKGGKTVDQGKYRVKELDYDADGKRKVFPFFFFLFFSFVFHSFVFLFFSFLFLFFSFFSPSSCT